jgi:putative CocE/NonD family hydrolase
VRDGTQLAVDVYRPTRNGAVESEPLPVVWVAKRYLRARVQDGEWSSTLLTQGGDIDQTLTPRKLIAHGYVLASADMRGTGASFGNWSECSDPSSSSDGYDITEWLAAQPWCNGSIGMLGASYEGRMQLNTASAAPPHLKAIMPEVSPFDWYEIIHDGGIYESRFEWTGDHFRGCDVDPPVAPVDDDLDGSMAALASKEHEAGNDYSATKGDLPFRDSRNANGVTQWLERSGEVLLPGIINSGVATYQTSGFFARVGIDQLLWFSNLARSATGNRHRILIGPWPHGGVIFSAPETREAWAIEALRFFDYWLKDIDNGLADEPPVIYTTQTSRRELDDVPEWRVAAEWPPAGAQPTDFYFGGGPSGSVASSNDGLLSAGATDAAKDGRDEVTIDYGLVSPPRSESTAMASGFWEGGVPGTDFSDYDAKCITYTTERLDADLEVTGHPFVRLFASTTADDGDFFVHLEDVDQSGVSTYVSRGCLRASHRAERPAPYYRFEMPWHSYNESDVTLIPSGEIVELAFDLLPVSHRFRAGNRIRVTVAGADIANALTPAIQPAPQVTIHRDPQHRSRITLPVMPASA